MDQGKEEFVCLASKKKEDDLMEQAWKTIKEESRLRKMKMLAAAAASGNIKQTEGDDTDEFEELLEGTVVLSPKESSTNNPKDVMKMNVEQAAAGNNQDEELIISPKESSTNNPKGQKRVREEEEDKDKDKDKKLKAADSLSDTCTSNKFPSTSPIGKSMDFDEDDEMWSSLGDL